MTERLATVEVIESWYKILLEKRRPTKNTREAALAVFEAMKTMLDGIEPNRAMSQRELGILIDYGLKSAIQKYYLLEYVNRGVADWLHGLVYELRTQTIMQD